MSASPVRVGAIARESCHGMSAQPGAKEVLWNFRRNIFRIRMKIEDRYGDGMYLVWQALLASASKKVHARLSQDIEVLTLYSQL